MSTRALIGIKENGSIMFVLCQHDGYPSYTGRILLEKYNTPETLKKLLSGGSMSAISEDNVDYYADEDSLPKKIWDVEWNRTLNKSMCDFFYIYDVEEREWFFSSWGTNKLYLLTTKDCEEN